MKFQEGSEEAAGKIVRYRDADAKRLAFIDAELSQAARHLKTAASQLEAMLDRKPSGVQSALSRVDIDQILKFLAEREQLCRRIGEANVALRRLCEGSEAGS